MHDNVPSHASHFTTNFLNEHNFCGSSLMTWPATSPDLNPIEKYWGVFKELLYNGPKQYTNKNKLWNGICDTFAKMDKVLISKLINSIDDGITSGFSKKSHYINH